MKNLVSLRLKLWPTGTILFVVFFIFGLGIGQKIYSSPNIDIDNDSEQIRLGSGKFTNPLLECEIADGTINSEKVYFNGDLRKFVDKISGMNGSINTSVYFRDMNNGPIIEINTENKFMPASLLKVPVMISYFKKAELDSSILNKKVTFDAEKNLGFVQTIPPEKQLVIGKTYTVEELINQMIDYSDNQALSLLWPLISVEEYKKLYKQLGVDENVVEDPTYSITVKEYSRFFRVLFNSSYLSQDSSEKALRILSESHFKEGIRSKIPQSIPVADKFGERQIDENSTQIHDCGIVYYPKHPYMLCIMTSGKDQKKLIDTVSQISGFVFDKIDSHYKAD